MSEEEIEEPATLEEETTGAPAEEDTKAEVELQLEEAPTADKMEEEPQEENRDAAAERQREMEEMGDEVSALDNTPSAMSNFGDSANTVAPKNSTLSYDGRDHHSHKEAQGSDINDALYNLVEVDSKEATPGEKRIGEGAADVGPPWKAAVSYSARRYDENKILELTRKTPPKHEYAGYVFSSNSNRPSGMREYFLPFVPQPCARKHIAVIGARVPPEALHASMKTAPKGLFPLSTVRITWRSSPNYTVYNLSSLYAYLTKFGDIESIYQRSANCALVIFCELKAARDCIKCSGLGMPWDVLVATWWEPRMHNQGYMAHQVRLEERNNLIQLAKPDQRADSAATDA